MNEWTVEILEAVCCGHIFQTVKQRRDHEGKAFLARERGDELLCPCGDLCSVGTVRADEGAA
jgi:hypothetical protein